MGDGFSASEEQKMLENFEAAFNALMQNEGGYSNNPNDPGGETNFGITKRVAVKWGYAGEMKDLPIEEAKRIAKAAYWDIMRCDTLPPPLDFQVFDAAYNSGTDRAQEWLEKSFNAADPDVEKMVMRFDAYRLLFLDSLGTWPSFGRGWARRIAENLLRAAA
jgi:lysozyme family protein